jgi:flavin reductase (DIM6/NTAB) family NADH-FMN oxidoreductase RutF
MISPVRFREVMAATPAPVTVVTTTADSQPAGATVSAFMSLSLEPTLVGVCLRRGSRLLDLIQARGVYGVNLLAEYQSEIAVNFATQRSDRFASVRWAEDHGLPRLNDCAAWLACDVESVIGAGDHDIVVGRVTDAHCSATPPLIYSHHQFGTNSSIRSNGPRRQTEVLARVASFDGAFY